MAKTIYDFRIFIACKECHYKGKNHGAWIEVEGKDDVGILEEIDAMLATSPCSGSGCGWAIYDFEGFGAIEIGEKTSLKDVITIVEGLQEYGEIYEAAYECRADPEYAMEFAKNCFLGVYGSKKEWAEEYVENAYNTKADTFLLQYFDYDSFIHDCECDGMNFIEISRGNVYVFST